MPLVFIDTTLTWRSVVWYAAWWGGVKFISLYSCQQWRSGTAVCCCLPATPCVILITNSHFLLYTTFSDRYFQWDQTVHCQVRTESLYLHIIRLNFSFERWKGRPRRRSSCCCGWTGDSPNGPKASPSQRILPSFCAQNMAATVAPWYFLNIRALQF